MSKRFYASVSQDDEGSSLSRRRTSTPKKYSRGRYAPLKQTSVAKTVRKVLEQQAEKKKSQYTETDKLLYAYNAGAPWTSGIFPVTPYGASLQISQGVGDGGRVGNRIKISKLRFKGMIVPTGYNATSNSAPEPQFVKMWLLYDKEAPNTIPAPGTDFLQAASSSNALTGTASDMFARVNTDRWVVKYEKVFKMGFATYGGTGTSPAFQSLTNNDFKLSNEFDIDLMPYIAKHVTYDDNTSIPETRGLFCVMEVVNIYGNTNPAASIKAEMHFQLDMEYTDL